MNMFKRFSLLLAPLIILMAVFSPISAAPALAKPYDSKYFSECNGSSDNQIICTARLIFNWASIGVTTVVVIMIVIGAIQYIMAGDSQEKAKQAIGTIKNALLALVLFLLMWSIVNFVIPGGIFN